MCIRDRDGWFCCGRPYRRPVIAVSSVVNVSTRWPSPVCATSSLVCAEPDVTMGPEHLRVTELVAELGQQGLHRPANLFVVDLLVRLPVGPGVVDLQALVEIKNRIGPAVERHCWSFHLRWAPGNLSLIHISEPTRPY